VPQEELRSGVRLLQSWVGRAVRAAIADGRVVTGTLRCIDPDRNLVLAQADERVGDSPPIALGYVVVPGKHLVRLWVENLEWQPGDDDANDDGIQD
jgi:small nuclear ribonucleoprotein (snRNP)-like protein